MPTSDLPAAFLALEEWITKFSTEMAECNVTAEQFEADSAEHLAAYKITQDAKDIRSAMACMFCRAVMLHRDCLIASAP